MTSLTKQFVLILGLFSFCTAITAQMFADPVQLTDGIYRIQARHVVDFDNDGFMDVIYSTRVDETVQHSPLSTISIKRGSEIGEFYPAEVLVDLQNIETLDPGLLDQWQIKDIVDIDGDSDLDVLFITDRPSYWHWFENDGMGLISEAHQMLPEDNMLTFYHHPWTYVEDIDDDGDLDYVFKKETDGYLYYTLNDGLGNFDDLVQFQNTENFIWITEMAFEDVNQDGKTDVVVSDQEHVSYFPGLGNGQFGEAVDMALIALNNSWSEEGLELVDADGDNDLDVVGHLRSPVYGSEDPEVRLMLFANDGEGNFSEEHVWIEFLSFNSLSSIFNRPFVGDFNGNGKNDILAFNWGHTRFQHFEQDNEGTFQLIEEVTQPENELIERFLSDIGIDIDADSDLDCVYQTVSGKIGWMENLGMAEVGDHQLITNTPLNSYYSYDSQSTLEFIDIDFDGDLDIIDSELIDGGTNEYAIRWFENLSINNAAVQGDFDGDGIVGTGDLTIFLTQFGIECEICQADLNDDGLVSAGDLTILLTLFGSGG